MRYSCHISPFLGNGYGEEVDVTQYVLKNGFKKIEQTIDNSDYVIGAFSYNSINLKLTNHTGLFSFPVRPNSIFTNTRDRAIVTIRFDDRIVFKGVINEEATKEDIHRATLKLQVLSEDSILRKTYISSGAIPARAKFSDAIRAIFKLSEISAILKLGNIDVLVDEEIDDTSALENRSCRDSINDLLNVAGSVMSVSNSVVTIGPRSTTAKSRNIVYGDSDALRRRPVIFNIKDYNSGMHRLFNSVSINEHRVIDRGSIEVYVLRERENFEYPFLTDLEKINRVAMNILEEFRYPREEMKVLFLTEEIGDVKLSENLALDFTPLAKPSGNRLPLYGSAKYGEGRYPFVNPGPNFPPTVLWTIYEKVERPQDYLTEIKLRRVGRGFGEEFFLPSIFGIGVYGSSVYQEGTLPNIAIGTYGNARYNSHQYGG